MTEFCSYLEETNELYALFMRCLPLPQYYRLLGALHHNASIKELHMIHNFDKYDDEDDFGEAMMGLLSQHKNDF